MKMIKGHRLRFRRSLVALIAAMAIAPFTSAQAATVHGSTDAIAVWVSAPSAIPKVPEAEMRNRDRSFIPNLLVIPAGASVRFPNDDPFYHSIYSTSSSDPFDIGYYDNGPGKVVTFNNPGIVNVHCHIHAFMHAWIIVTDGPYAIADSGAYSVDGVPAGKHQVHTWDPSHGERTYSVDVPSDDANVTLDLK